MATLFATTYPERTRGLILTGTQARWWRSDDFPYPVWTQPEYARIVDQLEREGVTDEWLFGPGAGIPSDDPAIVDLAYRYVNAAASPSALAALEHMNMQIDTRDIVGLVQVPTLVINAIKDPVSPLAGAQWLADHVPEARLLTLDSGNRACPAMTACRPPSRSSDGHSPGAPNQPDARDRAPHGHRRIDRESGRARGSALERFARSARPAHARATRPLRRHRGAHDRRWVPRHVRRTRTRGALRVRHPHRAAARVFRCAPRLHPASSCAGHRRERHRCAPRSPHHGAVPAGTGARVTLPCATWSSDRRSASQRPGAIASRVSMTSGRSTS